PVAANSFVEMDELVGGVAMRAESGSPQPNAMPFIRSQPLRADVVDGVSFPSTCPQPAEAAVRNVVEVEHPRSPTRASGRYRREPEPPIPCVRVLVRVQAVPRAVDPDFVAWTAVLDTSPCHAQRLGDVQHDAPCAARRLRIDGVFARA